MPFKKAASQAEIRATCLISNTSRAEQEQRRRVALPGKLCNPHRPNEERTVCENQALMSFSVGVLPISNKMTDCRVAIHASRALSQPSER